MRSYLLQVTSSIQVSKQCGQWGISLQHSFWYVKTGTLFTSAIKLVIALFAVHLDSKSSRGMQAHQMQLTSSISGLKQ